MRKMKIYFAALAFLIFIIPAYAKSPSDSKLYIAAALFNSRETHFNIELVKQIEAKQYKTIFPQRDGFEYNLLAKTTEKATATATIQRGVVTGITSGISIPVTR